MFHNNDPDEATAMLELRRVPRKWQNAARRPLEGNEAYLSTESIERRFSISRSDVLRAIKNGLLAAFRGPANKWLIHPTDFENYRKQL